MRRMNRGFKRFLRGPFVPNCWYGPRNRGVVILLVSAAAILGLLLLLINPGILLAVALILVVNAVLKLICW